MSGPWAVASAFGKPGGGGVCPGENPRASGPPVRMCFGGYSQECCKARSKAYLKTQMRAGGRGFKKNPAAHSESTVGKKLGASGPIREQPEHAGSKPLLHWPLGGAAAEHLVVHRLESGQLAWSWEWRRVVGGGCGVSVMNSELAPACG